MPKPSTVAIYASVFALIVAVIAVGYRAPQQTSGVANATPVATDSQAVKQTSVDEIVATNIAASLAETTNLSVANNVANLSVSLAAQSEVAQTDETVASKPQILEPSASRTVETYVSVAGDTADSLAAKFGVTKETIKWANGLSSDAIPAGKQLKILPTDGVLYTVKAGDTTASIAQKYNADQARVVLYNDLDVSGIVAGQQIILPSGSLPETERPGYVAPRPATRLISGGGGSSSSNIYRASAGNRYSFGYCTWYVFERRAELGRPIGSFWGNASNWAYAAGSAGYSVNRTPEVGAIIQNGGGLGHVAMVEEIRANGDLVLSEMNYGGGWNQLYRGRVIPAGQVSLYNYIH